VRRSLAEDQIRPIVIGTRGSTLALIQTNRVVDALKEKAPDLTFEIRTVKTLGDRVQGIPLGQFGGTGVFVRELDQMLVDRQIDLAVHSLKDVPPDQIAGVTLAAFPERDDPRDVIASNGSAVFAGLPAGARVGTSSVRRRAQLRSRRPDLEYRDDLRGNVETRLRKLRDGQYDAIVLAAAGLLRLDRASEISEYLPVDVCLPDAGQGTLAVTARSEDTGLVELLRTIDDATVRAVSLAERAVLTAFGGGCKVPVAAYAERRGNQIDLRGLVATPDGGNIIQTRASGPIDRPDELGATVWQRLVEAGALDLLAVVNRG
jgi:hydroxymethylbilane synthase